jgi:NAD(P)-dependent dehydrogenase (short-subunit alcohol dehydrogenase family)
MPEISGRRVLITGATDGIGKQTAFDLARRGFRVVVHGRDAAKVDATVAEVLLLAASGGSVGAVEGIVADLASLAAVRRMVEEAAARFPDLAVLVNNAAVYMEERAVSGDGIELNLHVNHIAPMFLTQGLTPLLSSNGATEPSRVVFVSSLAQLSYPGTAAVPVPPPAELVMQWDNLQGEKDFHPFRTYALCKLCNVITAADAAERHPFAESRVSFTSMTPGPVQTKLLRKAAPEFVATAFTVEQGAESVVRLVTEDVGLVSGAFVNRDGSVGEMSALAKDPAVRQRLMRESRTLADAATRAAE